MREFELNGYVVQNSDTWFYDLFEEDYISPAKVRGMLDESDGEDVVFNINSGGGDLYSGINICDMMRAYHGNVEIHVCGIAASAASIIAMGGKCLMSPASTLMIHNTSCMDSGNRFDKAKIAGDLKVSDRAIAALYSEKSGKGVDEIMKMMDKETFLTAQDALDFGLVDGILDVFEKAPNITNVIGGGAYSRNMIDKVKELVIASKKKPDKPNGVPVEQLKKRLNLLRR